MKYLCLVYYDEKKMQKLSQTEWGSLNRECMNCVAGLQASGHFLDGAPLRLAEKIPPARYGNVEIRPVRELADEGNTR